ncbi:MAG: SEC-C domain-containing protein [Alphaproteobacteria bacterium]|nr:SEC-C domain-containing protein [Alphaproteobacteria bacterium]MDE2074676.1 SEC-C domain-containing protein [Alphaproteobacteria bacterium]
MPLRLRPQVQALPRRLGLNSWRSRGRTEKWNSTFPGRRSRPCGSGRKFKHCHGALV